ncbi:hypothetical protein GQ607_011174 [Colletotrichum asianum]|uniref:Transmembrane protein n=1 Tax=Colletotrichum asianum TaxID=702518 RepID=A0A8H3W3E6_9PEZI|nr:hypothetical protein GQ607_011174 [Colletotrichum asianum]
MGYLGDLESLCSTKPEKLEPNPDVGGIGSVLSLCDVQILTGLGILVSAYINMGLDKMSAYHWHVVVYLAWFSNLTHIACLAISRAYLHQHQNERMWRLGLMLVLWILLLVAIGPTLWMSWMVHDRTDGGLPRSNARCFFHPSIASKTIQWRKCEFIYGDEQDSIYKAAECVAAGRYGDNFLSSTEGFHSAVTSIVLTVFTFCFTRMAKIVEQWSITIRRNVRSRVNKFDIRGILSLLQKPCMGWKARLWTSILFLRVAINLTASLYADLVSSELSDVYWLLVYAVWGTLRIIGVRRSVTVDEDSWEFGQILPVFLLIGPIMTTVLPIIVSRPMVTGTPGLSDSTASGSHFETQGTPQSQAESNAAESYRMRSLTTQLTLSQNTDYPSWEGVAASAEPAQALGNLSRPLSRFLMSTRSTDWMSAQVTAEDVDNQLRSYYRQDQWMKQVTILACLQVVPVTVMIVLGMSGLSNALFVTISYATNVLLLQPLNCLFAVLFDLISPEDHLFRKHILGLSVIVWPLLLIVILPLALSERYGYDLGMQLGRLGCLGVILFLTSKVTQRLRVLRSSHHGVDNA